MRSWASLFLILFCSCTHKPQYRAVPVQTQTQATLPSCDSINITYYKDIQPIFRSNCYDCHSSAATASGGGLNLEDTASLKTYLKNGFRGDGLYGSMLYHCILHSQNAQRMPPGYILDTCSLHKIHHWVTLGGPIP